MEKSTGLEKGTLSSAVNGLVRPRWHLELLSCSQQLIGSSIMRFLHLALSLNAGYDPQRLCYWIAGFVRCNSHAAYPYYLGLDR